MGARRVIIVGAGPAGSAAALALGRRRDVEVMLLDSATFPRDKICAGGLSRNAQGVLESLGMLEIVLAEANAAQRLRLVGPGGEEWSLGRTRSVVLPRVRFDHLMVQGAVRAGASLREGVRVKGLLREGHRVRGIASSEGDLEADAVIVAAGVLACGSGQRASTERGLSPSVARARRFLAVERRYEGWDFDPGAMEMIYATELLPGYGWVFPESRQRANVGVCVDEHHPKAHTLHRVLEAFLEEHLGERLRGASPVDNVRGQPIAWRASVPELEEPGAMWVGEAAGLTSAATGEGIWHALVSARAAAETLGAAFDRGEPAALGAYRRRCARALALPLFSAAAFSHAASSTLFPAALRLLGSGLGGRLSTAVLERL